MRYVLTLAAASLLLGGCSETDQCASASNPSECRAWTSAGGDINDYLVGGMIGYMMANRGGQTVIVQDPNYHGSYRPLRRSLMSESQQVQRLREKVARQKVELQRQQAANARKSAEIKSLKSGKSNFFSRSSFRRKK